MEFLKETFVSYEIYLMMNKDFFNIRRQIVNPLQTLKEFYLNKIRLSTPDDIPYESYLI